jgi:hypothetical protein
MTKGISFSIFYTTSILLKIPLSLMPAYFHLLLIFLVPQISLTNYVTHKQVLTFCQPYHPFYTTVHIQFFVCETQCYREISVVGLIKDSTHSLIPVSVYGFLTQYSGQHFGCVQGIIERKVCVILIGYLEILLYLVAMNQ